MYLTCPVPLRQHWGLHHLEWAAQRRPNERKGARGEGPP